MPEPGGVLFRSLQIQEAASVLCLGAVPPDALLFDTIALNFLFLPDSRALLEQGKVCQPRQRRGTGFHSSRQFLLLHWSMVFRLPIPPCVHGGIVAFQCGDAQGNLYSESGRFEH